MTKFLDIYKNYFHIIGYKKENKKRAIYLPLIALFLWYVWVLFPLMETGFIGDDAYNSQIRGALIWDNLSLWERLSAEIKGWLIGAGRFNPISWIYTWSLYYATNSILVVKSIAMLVIILSCFLFILIVKNLDNDKFLPLLICVLMPTLMQFRQWHDPIISFTFIIPATTFFCFLSIYSYIKTFQKSGIQWYFLTIFSYTFALLTYELSYFFLFIFVIIFFYNKKDKSDSLLILFILFLLVSHYIFSQTFFDPKKSIYPGSQINLNWSELFRAYWYQLVAGFPLSWRLASNSPHVKIFPLVGYQTYVFLVYFFMSVFLLFKWKHKIYKNFQLMLIGLFLTIVIPLAAALSGHQSEISKAGRGFGYITVYVQYFGVILLLLILTNFLLNFFTNKIYKRLAISIFISLFFSFSALLTRNENQFIVKSVEFPYKTPRIFLGDAIASGLLNDITENDIILSNYRVPSDNVWFLTQSANKKIYGCSINIEAEFIPCIKRNRIRSISGNVYGLSYQIAKDKNESYALLALLSVQNGKSDRISSLSFEDYKIYKNGKISDIKSNAPIDFLRLANLPMVLNGDGLDLSSVKAEKFPQNFYRFLELEKLSNSELRWSSGDSYIYIYNPLSKSVKVKFSGTLVRPNNGVAKVNIYLNDTLLKVYEVGEHTSLYDFLLLMPGENIIRLTSDAATVLGGDPRKIVFGLVNPNVREIN